DLNQRITYEFDGDFNGVYYDQNLAKVTDVSDLGVSITQNGQTTQLAESSTGENNTFTQTKTADNLKLKVYHKISNDKMTVNYHYVLSGLITNYQDTAELNWKILGAGWDVRLHNVKVTIQLPKPVDDLQAWTHGPLTGYADVDRKQGKVTLTLDELDTDEMLETHMLFPTTVTPNNSQVSNEKAKEKIQRAEAKLADEANQKRQAEEKREQVIKHIFSGIVFTLSLGFIGILVLNPGNKKTKLPPLKHSYEIPKYAPEVAFAVLNQTLPNNQAFSAHLLDLAGQGKLEIVEASGKKNYVIKLKDKTLLEDGLLRFLFENVGNGTEFDLKSLKRIKNKRSRAKALSQKFDKWAKRVKNQADAYNYIDKKTRAWCITVMLGAFVNLGVLLLLGIIFSGMIRWLCLGLGIVIILLSAKYLLTHSSYTSTGEREIYELRCFKAMLKDVGRFDLREVGDIVLWEQIMPYAVAFGLAKKVIKALKAEFSVAELETGFGIYYALYFAGSWNDSFTSSFEQSIAAANVDSSAGGSSGGFSGGSSGGGGGGTGGAF
ncbi:MAG: DUF2207 domain-containing protein, partial [Ligilactobacillus sp.]|nr:DUF2207 domain-containing protein [Ligilactobacillus sp.]